MVQPASSRAFVHNGIKVDGIFSNFRFRVRLAMALSL